MDFDHKILQFLSLCLLSSCNWFDESGNQLHIGPVDFMAIRFSEELQDLVKNKGITIPSDENDLISKIDSQKTEVYDVPNNAVSSTLYNEALRQKSIYDCQYIGQWNGINIAYRKYTTGGNSVFSEIFTYEGKFRVKKVIFRGDRATNGILPNPVLSDDGKIYFYANLTTEKIIEIIERNKESKTIQGGCAYWLMQLKKLKPESATSYWNTCKLVYDIKKNNLDIRSITFSISKIAETNEHVSETPVICMNEYEIKHELYNWLIKAKKKRHHSD